LSEKHSVKLYNLKNDLGERENQCNREPEKRDELLDDLLEWMRETNAPVPSTASGF